jgi:two-component system, NtrC family, sensor kinase
MSNDIAIPSLEKKIDDLNQQAWNIRVTDSPGAFELSKESVERSREINYTKGLAEGLRTLGFCYVRLSNNDDALPHLKESFSLFESLNDPEGQAVVYEYLGIIRRNWGDLGSSLELLLKALGINEEQRFIENEGTNHYQLGVTYKHLGDFEKALEHLYRSMEIGKELGNDLYIAYAINFIGTIYFETSNYKQALDYFLQGLIARQSAGDKWGEAGSLDNIGFTYLKLKDYAQAINYCKQSLEITRSTGDKKGQANTLLHLAEIYNECNDAEQAAKFCAESLQIRRTSGDKKGEAEVLLFLAGLRKPGVEDKNDIEVLQWLSGALQIAEQTKSLDLLSKARGCLYEYYKRNGDFKQAIDQLEMHISAEKELHKNAINQKVLNLEISKRAEEARKDAETTRRRNEELTQLNEQIELQKKKLIDALADLKATQAQLIQSEKMASLGELTAGIAHEIQNPLNFVNNFSDINTELIDEMKEALESGNRELATKIASDISSNEEKINNHGKRADAIVKNMLQHSRTSNGKKELTDLNALVYEYLRLSYHGLRAKDKAFSAKYKTGFDNSIGKINIVPQDIGRVLLNLMNNAFYSVNEKHASADSAGQQYEPTVTINTKKTGDNISISVADNGKGIPQSVLDKIFQPFFTTKPTGQGTGLGLSLAYDIIKANGGELKVETREGEGAEFLIQLPLV